MKQTGRLVVLAAVAFSLACTGGGSGTSGGAASSPAADTLKIAVIPKGTSHVFWQSIHAGAVKACLLYTSPSPRDGLLSRMPSSA